MKKRFTFLFVLTIWTITSLFSQTSLKIINTDFTGGLSEDGTIEEALIAVQPQGAYMEVEMIMTFSANGLNIWEDDDLEIVLDFNLPTGSIIHDSWLWLPDGETIVKADVMDIRTASNIYEDIVDRAQDPSLLYRKSDGGYKLRIFPLTSEWPSRKVKISYLAPAIWSSSSVETWLPTQILNSSFIPLESARILTKPDPVWSSPILKGFSDIEFQDAIDPVYGEVLVADISNDLFEMPMKFSVEAPFNEEGVFVNKLEEGDDNFYQVAYLPPAVIHEEDAKNILVIFDHDEGNSHINKLALFEHAKNVMIENLKPQDQFNIIFSTNDGNQFLSDDWISAEESSMEAAFSQLSDPINDYSNLYESLSDGINFIKNNGGEGDILLLANTSHIQYWNGVDYAANLLDLIGADDIRMNIINYQNLNLYLNWDWGGFYFGYAHKTLYETLTFYTSGNFYSILGGTFNTWEGVVSAFADLYQTFYLFDFNTTLENGLTYQRFNQTYMGQSKYPGKPIVQVGKYLGDFPMVLNFAGASEDGFISDYKTVSESDVYIADTLSREIWTGHYLRYLEGNVSGNADEQEIIDISIAERVLSKYTAFLALDIENGGDPCLTCWGYEYLTVDGEEIEQEEIKISVVATPNPFSDACRIQFELTGVAKGEPVSIQIFDAFGKLISTIDTQPLLETGTMEWIWGGMDQNGRLVPNGTYLLNVKSSQGSQTVKIMVLR